MIKPKNIDHVCLIVSNLQKSKKYYERLFDFSCKKHPTNYKMIMVDSKYVHFFLKEMKMPRKFLENQHLSFEVDSLGYAERELRKFGVVFEKGLFKHFRHRNYKWIEWHDPDGIRLECVEKA